ncbi:MAG: four helix bundle protein [Desulfobacterales bacterium]
MMARYEHLPVYKLAMELGIFLQGVVRKFSRYNKYSIGSELREVSIRIIRLIVRANSTESGRSEVLQELVENCELFKTMLVFAKEGKAFDNFNSFQQLSKMAVLLSKQSEGWLKSSKKSLNCQPPERAGR